MHFWVCPTAPSLFWGERRSRQGLLGAALALLVLVGWVGFGCSWGSHHGEWASVSVSGQAGKCKIFSVWR